MAAKAMLFDTAKCIGCRGCQVACKQWNELKAEATTNVGYYENPPSLSANTWTKVRFQEIGSNGTVKWLFRKEQCMHCSKAVCVMVCPTYARAYHDSGYVTIDYERCIGCGRCEAYCPFGVPKLGSHDVSPRFAVELGTPRTIVYSCTFCKDRVEDGLAPACAKTCPTGAIQFGEQNYLVEQGRARVRSLKATYPQAYLYGENELGGLHVMYILTEKVSTYGLTEQPQIDTYPEFKEDTFPDWYRQAIVEGKLPVFPPGAQPQWYLQPGLRPGTRSTEPPWPPEPARPSIGWLAKAYWAWLGLGASAALGAIIRRRMQQEREKQRVSNSKNSVSKGG